MPSGLSIQTLWVQCTLFIALKKKNITGKKIDWNYLAYYWKWWSLISMLIRFILFYIWDIFEVLGDIRNRFRSDQCSSKYSGWPFLSLYKLKMMKFDTNIAVVYQSLPYNNSKNVIFREIRSFWTTQFFFKCSWNITIISLNVFWNICYKWVFSDFWYLSQKNLKNIEIW